VLGGAAVVVGLLAGSGVWLFKALIEVAHWAAFEWLGGRLAPLGSWTVGMLPVLGGLVVGLIVWGFVGEERHHGVAGIMEAVALAGGRLRYWRMPAKAVSAAVSIGAGASVGPEDPSVQIGANLGSLIGQALRLSDERMRALVAAGAAAGVAAAFNAPIAGVFFALEIILGELSGGALSVVVMAAVISAVFTQAVSGTQPAFRVPAYAFGSAWELPLYLGLGLLAGPLAALYVAALYRAQDLFHRLRRVPRWLKPALAGVAVGAIGVFLPQVMGVGYETIEAILANAGPSLGVLAALLLAKLLLTPASIGGGFPGGVFAPSLFLGACLGAAYGSLAERFFPGQDIVPAAFAMVGMAAVLAGAVHAPLTAILLLFEMTNDYRIILPLMFAVVISLLVSQRLARDSVYTLGLARKGIRLERGRDVEVLEGLTVREVMRPSATVLGEHQSLPEALATLRQHRHNGLPVVNSTGALVGVLTIQDIDRVPPEERPARNVGQACTRALVVAYPDETIGAAMRRMGARGVGRLPVVERNDSTRLVGLLRSSDLVRAYDAALTQRAAARHRAQQVRLGTLGGVRVEEVAIRPGAPCAGQLVRAVPWPPGLVIASLRRGRQVIIPDGSTLLRAGDVLMAVAEGEAQQQLQFLCAPAPEPPPSSGRSDN
jgi:CIC family chloride channel protein